MRVPLVHTVTLFNFWNILCVSSTAVTWKWFTKLLCRKKKGESRTSWRHTLDSTSQWARLLFFADDHAPPLPAPVSLPFATVNARHTTPLPVDAMNEHKNDPTTWPQPLRRCGWSQWSETIVGSPRRSRPDGVNLFSPFVFVSVSFSFGSIYFIDHRRSL